MHRNWKGGMKTHSTPEIVTLTSSIQCAFKLMMASYLNLQDSLSMIFCVIKRKVSISHYDLCSEYLYHMCNKTKSHNFCTSSWFDSMIKLYKAKYKTHCTKRMGKTNMETCCQHRPIPCSSIPRWQMTLQSQAV